LEKAEAWVASPLCKTSLYELTIDVGTAGAHIPVVTNPGGQELCLNRPIFYSDKMSNIGAAGDIALIDFSQLYFGLRRMLSTEQSQHVYFTSDETAFRALMRMDAQPKWAKAFTPRESGADTLSWCVTLADRD
jgi:hypothetical protein